MLPTSYDRKSTSDTEVTPPAVPARDELRVSAGFRGARSAWRGVLDGGGVVDVIPERVESGGHGAHQSAGTVELARAPLPATSERGGNRNLLPRSRRQPAGARLLPLRGRARLAVGSESAHPGRGPPHRRQHRQAAEVFWRPSNPRPPPHSITSSATVSRSGGMVRPSALAVLRLITSANLVGA